MCRRLFLASFIVAAGVFVSNAHADERVKADLERLTSLRIFFGHQSVGDNLLDGLAKLARQEKITLKIQEMPDAGALVRGTIGHTHLAENGNPLRKFESFARALDAKPAPVDIALMKVCYVDFGAGTDAKALFARYRTTIDALRARHPNTVFVHVTAPLTITQTGPKALIKRLLGRVPYGTAENLRREEYNALLRQTYGGREPIFDLASIESVDPQGRKATAEWQGKVVPAMAPAYTDDGGHLNEAGRLHAARALVATLAAASAPHASVADAR